MTAWLQNRHGSSGYTDTGISQSSSPRHGSEKRSSPRTIRPS